MKKNLLRNLKIVINAFFMGMRGADEAILESSGDGTSDSSIVKHIKGGGVMADLLDQKVTKEVEELRDATYRILKEADKYDARSIKMTFDDEGNPVFNTNGRLAKKNLADFGDHPPVLEEKNKKVRLIQDNDKIPFSLDKALHTVFTLKDDFHVTLQVERSGFKPRFELEKYVSKIVVKDIPDNTKAQFDLYCSIYAGQFDSVSALFVNELNKLYEGKLTNKDIIDFKGFDFITAKAFGSEDFKEYKIDNIKYEGIEIFDGHYVLKFVGDKVLYDFDVTEKYVTKELTEKYETHAPKGDTVDVFAAEREIKRKENMNLNKTTLKVS